MNTEKNKETREITYEEKNYNRKNKIDKCMKELGEGKR